jgi:LytS/YehU family sensor histidine kinase
MFAWTSIFFVMLYNTKLQKEHERLLKAKTLAKDAQLQMLRYQLNPHFMFNTMNAISTLILKKDNDKANEMLDKLCGFFRYSLDVHSKSTTILKNEIELLDLYLSIEKVRFGSRLTVEIDTTPHALSCRVPSLLLQPIVENAIKYAIEPRKDNGLIIIKAEVLDARLLINVIDDGNDVSNKNNHGFGIGISNTKARLDAMFNGNYNVSMITKENQGTEVSISIPFES